MIVVNAKKTILILTIQNPTFRHPIPDPKACAVSKVSTIERLGLKIPVASAVVTKTSPVIRHIITDKNAPTIDIKPCSEGVRALAAAAAIAELPNPASWQKIPRLIPTWMECMIPIPNVPPSIDPGENAS